VIGSTGLALLVVPFALTKSTTLPHFRRPWHTNGRNGTSARDSARFSASLSHLFLSTWWKMCSCWLYEKRRSTDPYDPGTFSVHTLVYDYAFGVSRARMLVPGVVQGRKSEGRDSGI
jgi:hypothetical protein